MKSNHCITKTLTSKQQVCKTSRQFIYDFDNVLSFRPNSVCLLLVSFFMKCLIAELPNQMLLNQTLYCNGAPGCALDIPNRILKGISGKLR